MSRKAFGLIELLVVLGVVGVLVGLTLPAVQQARNTAARARCQDHQRQIGLALHAYHDSHGYLPPTPRRKTRPASPEGTLSWMVAILPWMEQEAAHRAATAAFHTDPNPRHTPPHTGFATVIPPYTCPGDGRLIAPLTDSSGVRAAFTSFIGIHGTLPPGAKLGYRGALGSPFRAITDGLSQTVMVAERPPPDSLQAGWWYPRAIGYGDGYRGPNGVITLGGVVLLAGDPCTQLKGTFGPGRLANPCDRFHLWSLHEGGANFLLADGSVRFLTYSSEPIIFALASRDGGEVFELP